jgi:hypothetical protein
MNSIVLSNLYNSYRGYIEAISELEQQIQHSTEVKFDDIVVACGRYFIKIYNLLALYSSIDMQFILSCLDPESCTIGTYSWMILNFM